MKNNKCCTVCSEPNDRKIASKLLVATQRQFHVYSLTCKNLKVRSSRKNPLLSQERRGREEVLVTTKDDVVILHGKGTVTSTLNTTEYSPYVQYKTLKQYDEYSRVTAEIILDHNRRYTQVFC